MSMLLLLRHWAASLVPSGSVRVVLGSIATERRALASVRQEGRVLGVAMTERTVRATIARELT